MKNASEVYLNGTYTYTYSCVRCSERGPTEATYDVTGDNVETVSSDIIDFTADCEGHDRTFTILALAFLAIMIVLGVVFTAAYLKKRSKAKREFELGYKQTPARIDGVTG